MKLRNKKTGKHGDYKVISAGYLIRVKDCNSDEAWQYDCLAGFNDDWEDYRPAEPLIKDEKIRKAVRAWADANNYEAVRCNYYNRGCVMFSLGVASIVFMDFHEKIEADITYTIAELCGEEEE